MFFFPRLLIWAINIKVQGWGECKRLTLGHYLLHKDVKHWLFSFLDLCSKRGGKKIFFNSHVTQATPKLHFTDYASLSLIKWILLFILRVDCPAELGLPSLYCFASCKPWKGPSVPTSSVVRLHPQHSQEGKSYLCENTHVHGNPGELATAGWGSVEVQASAGDVQVCNQGFHCWLTLWVFLF